MASTGDDQELDREIAELEQRLADAKARRNPANGGQPSDSHSYSHSQPEPNGPRKPTPNLLLTQQPTAPSTSSTHFLFLLSDSALPLGSFAFSSGLESYLAHGKAFARQNHNQFHNHHQPSSSSSSSSRPSPFPPPSFTAFLPLSVSSYASTSLPFVLAAHRDPSLLASLDDTLDATIVCTVGRRASVAQGRALLSIWERSFAQSTLLLSTTDAAAILKPFSALLKTSTSPPIPSTTTTSSGSGWDDDSLPPPVSAHLAPLFGAICNLVGLTLQQTAYVFLLGHVKALVSAAVRAGMFGPYQAQKTLATGMVQELIDAMVKREWDTPVERAGQNVPVMDLWIGRHEVLYSRIFNS